MSCIDVQNLTKEWNGVVGVDNVSFQVAEGELTVLLGPSGCGKSTLLRLISGLETVSSGRISIAGKEITHKDPSQRGVSMVFQSYALFPHLSVKENILFGLKVRSVSKKDQQRRLAKAAEMVGLTDLLGRKTSQLSGGQCQRVALARSIVSRRKVCLMDEPLSNLDAKLRAQMRQEIRTLQKQLGLTMVYVTHDQVEAMTMADQVILLEKGRLVQAGSPKALYDNPATAFAARFMGSPPMNLLNLGAEKTAIGFWDDLKTMGFSNTRGGQFMGIRPEHIRLGTKGLAASVKGVDYLGAETLVQVLYRDQVLFVRANAANSFKLGETVHMTWSPDHIRLFDSQGDWIQDSRANTTLSAVSAEHS